MNDFSCITPHYHFALFSCRLANGVDAMSTVADCSCTTVRPLPVFY